MSARILGDDPRVAALAAFYESLTPASLERLDALYAPSARFIDPFNDVTGREPIRRVFEHMFNTLDSPRFVVLEAMAGRHSAFLLWTFQFRRAGGREQQILGTTHLRFDEQDRVLLHHDHWDAAGQLYETVPLLGTLMRWLRRRLAAPA